MTGRVRLAVAGAALSTLAGGLVAASAAPGKPCVMGRLGCAADVAAMADLETKMADHLRFGKAVAIDFGTPSRKPGNVVSTGGWGDSGLWSGVYLGGESFRYAVAKHYLLFPGLPRRDRQFWTAQRDQALARVRTILDGEHRDVNIAADWTGSLKVPPDVNTDDPTSEHAANFGGGVIHGEPGMLMRACTPAGSAPLGIDAPYLDPAKPVNNNKNRVFAITWTSGDKKTYNCETSPSRDTYAGVTFGMLTAFDLVSVDFPAMRHQIRADVLAMGDFLLKYGWNYPRPHGYVSANHDFDGFISPLFVYVPMARLNLTNAARHVADLDGDATAKTKWDSVWAEELLSQGPILAGSMEIDSAQPNDGYYKFNLHHLTGFNLLRTTVGAERDLIARSFAVMDKTTRDDLNAHFEALTYAVTGDTARRDAAVGHLRQWLTYRARVLTGAAITNSARCGKDVTCVPEDEYDLDVAQAPGGTVTWFPGQPDAPPISEKGKPRALRPLPVPDRAPSDFIWQRPPTQLDGQEGATHREPGIDFLTPYWLLRYFTEVSVPATTPFPEWPGPAHL